MDEIETEVERQTVQRLLELIRFRNEHPAFNGEFEVLGGAEDEIHLRWRQGETQCALHVDLKSYRSSIRYSTEGRTESRVL